ncbi:DUF6248 family natural product biosynthesis protein [Streptomyces sp. NPDC004237]|uniref:DUF6248 family natural product biosynthesis protein n=1 Tax=Streptomyces sp. NPDC004237 TaxID=3154455 RepID=UPI0033A705C9
MHQAPRNRRPAVTARARPQRELTEAEWELVRRTKLLNLHGALIMGIVDPLPNPSPIPEAQGAWVREQVWPEWMHEIERKYPFGFWRWSMCEKGTCWNCLNNRCDICVHRQNGGPDVDRNQERVHSHDGRVVATFIPRPGGEPCVWWCRCPCSKTGGTPRRPRRLSTVPEPAAPVTQTAQARSSPPPSFPTLFDLELPE